MYRCWILIRIRIWATDIFDSEVGSRVDCRQAVPLRLDFNTDNEDDMDEMTMEV